MNRDPKDRFIEKRKMKSGYLFFFLAAFFFAFFGTPHTSGMTTEQ